MKAALPLLAVFAIGNISANADLYMHNPRGSGALVTRFESPALDGTEVTSGKLVAKNRKWSPISIDMQGGEKSIGSASLKYVQKAFKSGKPVDLDFSSVNIDPKGGRRVLYRIHFDGAVVKSLNTVTKNGQSVTTLSFVFQKTTWTQVGPGLTTQDIWR